MGITEGNKGAHNLQFYLSGNGIKFVRKFYTQNEEKIAYHDYFVLPPQLQGKGLSKKILKQSLKEYEDMGIDKIKVFASLDGGGYTWAKYGFVAEDRFQMENLLAKAKKNLHQNEFKKVKNRFHKYYDQFPNGDEFPIIQWAAYPFMKEILRGGSWRGHVNMKNPQQLRNFKNYVSK